MGNLSHSQFLTHARCSPLLTFHLICGGGGGGGSDGSCSTGSSSNGCRRIWKMAFLRLHSHDLTKKQLLDNFI